MEETKTKLPYFDGRFYYCQRRHCLAMGIKWMSRMEREPKCCPRCKSYDWRITEVAPFIPTNEDKFPKQEPKS